MTSPKQRFLQNDRLVKAWNQVVESPEFQLAMDAAMLELMAADRTPGPVYDAQAAAHRLHGARLLAVTLARMGVREETRRTKDLESLDYEKSGPQAGMKPQSPEEELPSL